MNASIAGQQLDKLARGLTMILFHRTFFADAILNEGFRDAKGYYLTSEEHSGVWFSDVPLTVNEGADGDTVLRIEIPEDVIADFEWCEDEKLFREFLVPATIVNAYGPPAIEEDDWQGISEEELLKAAALREETRLPHLLKQATRIREKIPFLRKHNLLGGIGNSESQDA